MGKNPSSVYPPLVSFMALALLGCLVVPKLPFQLQPSQNLPTMSVSFAWPGASAALIERKATSLLEGVLSTLGDLETISSTTRVGSGYIQMDFDPQTDLDLVRFHCSALIRQLIPRLPEAVSYPQISFEKVGQSQEDQPLMNFTLNGQDSPYQLYRYAEEVLKVAIGQVKGVKSLEIYGGEPFAWELLYDPEMLSTLGLSAQLLGRQLMDRLQERPLATGMHFQGQAALHPDREALLNMLLTQAGGRRLAVKDVFSVVRKERPTRTYRRINGLNAIQLVLSTRSQANQLTVAQAVKKRLAAISQQLPPSYTLITTYDATDFLVEELSLIAWRSGLSLGLLLIFVLLVSRSLRYLLAVSLSLLANLLIAALGYYMLGLELHLYALAALTVSLGLIIDNSIVMIDHVKHQGNLKVFRALLAATLTTLGALSVIFFLDENTRLIMEDFAWVMLVNLGVSLAISRWMIPALHQALGLGKPFGQSGRWSKKRRILAFSSRYASFIRSGLRYRRWVFLAGLLAFGLPSFLLPEKWNASTDRYSYAQASAVDSSWYARMYDATVGSEPYRQDIRPWLDKVLGGSLRLFMEETYPNARLSEPGQTVLYVRGEMPYGSTLEQLNEIFVRMENYVGGFEEVAQYQTVVSSSQNGYMNIFFKPTYEKSGFPFSLKSRLEGKAVSLGNVDWAIYGVGRGFNNSIGMGYKNSRIVLQGYQYEQLQQVAESLRKRLLAHPRIKEVFINGQVRYDYRPNEEYVMEMDQEAMLGQGIGPIEVMEYLKDRSLEEQALGYIWLDGKYEPIILKPITGEGLDMWRLFENPIPADSGKHVKLNAIAQLGRRPVGDVIQRTKQAYQLVVEYDFIGPHSLQSKVRKAMIAETNAQLPLGYHASGGGRGWSLADKQQQAWLLFLVAGIIGMICAVLLESLRQPLIVLSMIPLAFIGTFMTFYLFELDFDQ
ncbi:MAG: efflux RND transporter permease subunit, partial [Bacteroidota bacterium]